MALNYLLCRATEGRQCTAQGQRALPSNTLLPNKCADIEEQASVHGDYHDRVNAFLCSVR